MAESKESQLRVDANNFVYVGEVRIARLLPESGSLQFLDRDRRRSEKRGTQFVKISLQEVANLGSSGE